jgi:hypothetical protein
MNIKNLKLLVKRLEEQLDSTEAARFNMKNFGEQYYPAYPGALQAPVCNTQACLAGEAALMSGQAIIGPNGGFLYLGGGPMLGAYIEDEAVKFLKLNVAQKDKLFYTKSDQPCIKTGWPKKFDAAYAAAKTPQGRLYVAIRRVEHFIKTKGRQ